MKLYYKYGHLECKVIMSDKLVLAEVWMERLSDLTAGGLKVYVVGVL